MRSSKWRQLLADYFSFSLREKWALFFLILTGLLFTIAPSFFPDTGPEIVQTDSLAEKALQQFDVAEAGEEPGVKAAKRRLSGKLPKRFFFDPNEASEEDWIQLGLRVKTARTILNYRSKGGRFKKADDLDKIYGLDPATAAQLKPFVRIRAAASTPSASNALLQKSTDGTRVPTPATPKERVIQMVDINRADSLAWLALPGIGPRLAGRILLFKSRLGGFCRVDQVGEVYGLPDSVFQKIKGNLVLDQEPIHQLNINEASEQELSRHPYIRYALARAIVQYRSLHGPFSRVSDLRQIHLMTPELVEKVLPYCKIE